MIKRFLIEALKIVLILSIGQIPFGKSTLGGEFVDYARRGFSNLPQQVSYWGKQTGLTSTLRRKLSSEEMEDEEEE